MYWASQVVPVVKKPPGESHGWRSLAGYTVHRVAQSWTWLKLLGMHACNVYTGCRDRLKSCDKSNLSQIIRSLWCENRGFFATGFIINSHCEIVKLHLYTDTNISFKNAPSIFDLDWILVQFISCYNEQRDLPGKKWFKSFQVLWAQRRHWHPTPVLLPGESHGQKSLVGCSPWGR